MADRNEEPHYPCDAIALLKTDHRKVKNRVCPTFYT